LYRSVTLESGVHESDDPLYSAVTAMTRTPESAAVASVEMDVPFVCDVSTLDTFTVPPESS
jgi:hypothetical protein